MEAFHVLATWLLHPCCPCLLLVSPHWKQYGTATVLPGCDGSDSSNSRLPPRTHFTQFSMSDLNAFVRTCGHHRHSMEARLGHRRVCLPRWAVAGSTLTPNDVYQRWIYEYGACVPVQRASSTLGCLDAATIPAAVNTRCLAGTC